MTEGTLTKYLIEVVLIVSEGSSIVTMTGSMVVGRQPGRQPWCWRSPDPWEQGEREGGRKRQRWGAETDRT